MITKFELEPTPKTSEMISNLQRVPLHIRNNVRTVVVWAMERVVTISKKEYLSAGRAFQTTQGVGRSVLRHTGRGLRVISGRLRASITREVKLVGNIVTGSVGTDVKYARYHEYGFFGEQTIREHWRRGTVVFGRRVRPYMAFIPKHNRRVNYSGKPFLLPAWKREVVYAGKLHQALGEAVKMAFEGGSVFKSMKG